MIFHIAKNNHTESRRLLRKESSMDHQLWNLTATFPEKELGVSDKLYETLDLKPDNTLEIGKDKIGFY
ncbi:hypothetical protein TNCT_562591 [Trichonephila clavata]|uniref:Uncharacterized protein n=1 Tax=Trichonephila clavata TaxID=2740835 RepID=A0A8X6FQY6_TRICU|nr:hypothetical protein TNCT_562591 [Trichonephila clavata]